MHSKAIQVGKVYRNNGGVCRKVDTIATDLNSSDKLVAWTQTQSKRGGIPSGTCPLYEFAYWAKAEVIKSTLTQEVKPVSPETEENAISEFVEMPPDDVPMPPNDLFCAFTVVLTKETRGRDLDATVAAIRQIKGVGSVTPVKADMQYFIARDQVKKELLGQLRDVLKG